MLSSSRSIARDRRRACDTRLADWKTRREQITADNAFHGAVVTESELRDWNEPTFGSMR
jgi:hypothetical protein